MRECRCRWRRDHGPWWMRFSVLWREGSLQRSSRPCLPVSLSRRSSLSPLVSLFPSPSLSLVVCLLFPGTSPSFSLRLSASPSPCPLHCVHLASVLPCHSPARARLLK